MTTAPTPSELLPCPFCGAGNTEIRENGKVWSGMGYTRPTSTSVFHHCTPTAGQPSRAIERVGRDRASAIAAWNQRTELEARKPLPLSAEGPVMDWRSIETAPKDGTWIMLWRAPAKEGDGWTADPLVIARWYEDEFGDAEWTWPDDPFDPFTPHGIARANAAVESGASWGEENFTHWIPLPSPPEAS
ncbi:Lar family restriction alleviation protein [Delftia tsuruhatensis]|uniref:Lar family restriction alleviation protein n=1 Tax=Delftia tsuruhatensis TaxID=180282 RepID=UPI0012AA99A2|nr:Lar family restriction alleviation protein [Delftia tsuruhatensis]QFS64791.1 DUF551 domain-containing protein [Delftia tsuruhatensis]